MKHVLSTATAVAVWMFSAWSPRLAAAPANDHFADRIALRGLVVSTSGDNLGATVEAGEPAPYGVNPRPASVWWSWTAPASGMTLVNCTNSWRYVNGLPGSAPLDTVLAVYTGTALTNLSLIASNDDAAGGSWSQVQFTARAGAVYQIVVAGFNLQATGSVSLNIYGPPASGAPVLPLVSLSAPTNGAEFVPGVSVLVTAEAEDDDGAIAKVEFYRNDYKIGSDPTHPYGLIWSNLPAGAWALRAVATDHTGLAATSAVVNVMVVDRQAVTVVLTNPAAGARLLESASPILGAVVFASVPVTKVSFFADNTLVGEATAQPYAAPWNHPAPGVYGLTAVAEATGGIRWTSEVATVTIIPDRGPTVALNSPASGTVFVAPVTLNLLAEAADADGTVAKVEFYANGLKVCESVSPPYGCLWSDVPANLYTIAAVATDNAGQRATSAVVTVTVNPDRPPTVALTGLTNGARYVIPAEILLTAVAEDLEGTVTNVELYANGLKLIEIPAPPFSYTWEDASPGSYALSAVAVDDAGHRATSAVVNVTINPNQPPEVALVAPTDPSALTTLETLYCTAQAGDPDGWVTRVEFFANDSRVGESLSSPFTLALDRLTPGLYMITAVAVDNGGLMSTSAPAKVLVSAPARPWGGLAFDGVSQYVTFGRAARLGLPAFTIELWFKWSGGGVVGTTGGGGVAAIPLLAKLQGEFDGDNRDGNYFLGIQPAGGVLVADLEEGATAAAPGLNHPVIGVTPVTTNAWHHAAVAYDGTQWQLFLDGRLEATQFVGQTPRWDSLQHLALATALDSTGAPHGFFSGVLDEVRIWDRALPLAQIQAGRELPLVEAPGLVGRWALDATNGLSAVDSTTNATVGVLVNGPAWTVGHFYAAPPDVALSSPAEETVAFSPGELVLSAEASDLDGVVVGVEFQADGVKLGAVSHSPYEFTWVNPPLGTHTLRAVATDNDRQMGISAPVRVRVENPLLQFVSPQDGERMIGPLDLRMKVEALDSGGAVGRVEFFADGTKLGEAAAPPFAQVWHQAPLGRHDLMAVATLEGGIRTTSAPVSVIVAPVSPPVVSLSHPTNGSYFIEPLALSLAAQASSPAGVVSRVQFFVNGTELSESSLEPYEVIWDHPQVGQYELTAVVTDNFGFAATSAVVNVTVASNLPPAVAISSPNNGARFASVRSLTLAATASDADGAVRTVSFYVNGVSFGTVSNSPYRVVWNDPAPGAYQITAVATDDRGLSGTSAVANVTLVLSAPPQVSLTSPDEAARFILGDPVVLSANATDSDGSIVSVEFYAGSTRLATVTRSPYGFTWTGMNAGTYTLRAVATDNSGLSTTSGPVHVTVQAPDEGGGGDEGWSSPVVPHVVHISVDALGAAYLQRYLANAPAAFPTFARLQREGAWTLNARTDYTYSITIPNHACMFTGRPVDRPEGWANTTQHGVHTDSDTAGKTIHDPSIGNPNVPYKASVFDVAHDNGRSTAFLYTKASLKLLIRSWDAAHGAPDAHGANKIDYTYGSQGSNSYGPTAPVVDDFIRNLQANALWNYTFIHFDDPDSTGHASGWGSTAWSNAVVRVDLQLGRVLDAIRASPTYASQTIVLVTADHGGGGYTYKGHSEAKYYTNFATPFFLWGTGIPAGTNLYSLMANRGDPGTNRLDYNAPVQPLRTGDSGNLALALLGLPAIPGSTILPEFIAPPPRLRITRAGANVLVSWPLNATGYQLQSTTLFSRSPVWQPISSGISTAGNLNIYTLTPTGLAPTRFFRLRK